MTPKSFIGSTFHPN